MIEVVTEIDPITFLEKVRNLLSKGFVLKGAECSKGIYTDYNPFIYTAILIKII